MYVSAIARLRSVRFRVARRGYDRRQVNHYLEELAAECERLETQLRVDSALRGGSPESPAPAEAAPAGASSAGATEEPEIERARRVLELAERIRERAEGDARAVRERAEREAERLLADAEADVATARAEAEADAERLRGAALAAVDEMIELGKHRAVSELERAFARIDEVGGRVRPRGRRFDRAAYERRRAERGSGSEPEAAV